jgi:tripartite-type tricarboxylate transporter receptor subunit TctC
VVRAGTDPKVVKALSDALAVAAKDPDYVKYLQDQYAASGSFVAADEARAFLDGELKAMKSLAAQVGMTKAEAPAAAGETKKN